MKIFKRLLRGLTAACAVWVIQDAVPAVSDVLSQSPQYGALAVAVLGTVGKSVRVFLYDRFPNLGEWFPI